MNKKEWLDYLYYKLGKQQCDFHLCSLTKLEDGSTKGTRWKKYSEIVMPIEPWEDWKLKYINQRQILPNEIVLDLEEKESINKIIKELRKDGQSFYVIDTKSRGYHIHLFSKNPLTKKQKLKFIKKFGADEQLAEPKHMINLETSEHWKSGEINERVFL